jgi:RbcX protein
LRRQLDFYLSDSQTSLRIDIAAKASQIRRKSSKMDIKQVANSTARILVSYLTYQAMRVVVGQLSETNPPLSMWLQGFSSTGKLQDGEAYIQELLLADQDLAFRIMTVREYLADQIADFLPEMTRTEVKGSNMQLRCQHLERLVHGSPLVLELNVSELNVPELSDSDLNLGSSPEPNLNPENLSNPSNT